MVWRAAWAALLLAQDAPVERWVAELGSEDIEVRERANAALAMLGPRARRALEAAARSKDAEVAARARALLAPPLRLEFGFDPARGDGSGRLPLTLKVQAPPGHDAVYLPRGLTYGFELLELFDEPDDGRYGGGLGGRRQSPCALAESDFQVVPSGDPFERKLENLCGYPVTPARELRERYPEIGPWTVGTAGVYRVTARYRFDRQAYKSRCPNGCASHDDPSKPWNRCFEGDFTLQAKFVILKSDRCGCGRRLR